MFRVKETRQGILCVTYYIAHCGDTFVDNISAIDKEWYTHPCHSMWQTTVLNLTPKNPYFMHDSWKYFPHVLDLYPMLNKNSP